MTFEYLIRQPESLTSEQQDVILPIRDPGIRLLGAGAETENAAILERRLKFRQVPMPARLDRGPVIEAGSLQAAVIQTKAQPADQMQLRPVAAQRRAMLPVFGGISGSHRATCSMAIKLLTCAIVGSCLLILPHRRNFLQSVQFFLKIVLPPTNSWGTFPWTLLRPICAREDRHEASSFARTAGSGRPGRFGHPCARLSLRGEPVSTGLLSAAAGAIPAGQVPNLLPMRRLR